MVAIGFIPACAFANPPAILPTPALPLVSAPVPPTLFIVPPPTTLLTPTAPILNNIPVSPTPAPPTPPQTTQIAAFQRATFEQVVAARGRVAESDLARVLSGAIYDPETETWVPGPTARGFIRRIPSGGVSMLAAFNTNGTLMDPLRAQALLRAFGNPDRATASPLQTINEYNRLANTLNSSLGLPPLRPITPKPR